MSDTDRGSMGLPPCDVFLPTVSGVASWTPSFDRVEVARGLADPAGGRILIVWHGAELRARIVLDAAAAAHLAALLSDAPKSAPLSEEEPV